MIRSLCVARRRRWAPQASGTTALPPRCRPPTSARMSDEHPARLASKRSIAAVRAKDKAAWLALFADDAVIEDPVGVSPIDPTGKGHRGREAIDRFWDKHIAPVTIDFEVRESHASGERVRERLHPHDVDAERHEGARRGHLRLPRDDAGKLLVDAGVLGVRPHAREHVGDVTG